MLSSLVKQRKRQKQEDEQEFDLINPMAKTPQGAIPDKDFEPKDPGWPYPDNDWGWDKLPSVDNHTDIED